MLTQKGENTLADSEELVLDKFADNLRSRIKAGEYGTSGTLPSTSDLASQWKTSRTVVTQVMLLLRSEGYIRMINNRYLVNHPRFIFTGMPKDFGQYLKDHGFEPVMENLIEPSLETMSAEIATLFDQPVGESVVHRIRKQSMRKEGIPDYPLRIAENWYPARLAEDFLEEMRTNGYIHVVEAIKAKYGISIVKTKEDTLARIPTRQEASWLNLARYQPVFELLWSNFASDGQPVMFNRIIMVATNFRLSREYPVEHWS
ncbi:MAG: GntR family transcriptional regulator [Chloroflexi bacterium]|nr:MAG: GntR family transcriptional regulator [Chloroflexota bacterium]